MDFRVSQLRAGALKQTGELREEKRGKPSFTGSRDTTVNLCVGFSDYCRQQAGLSFHDLLPPPQGHSLKRAFCFSRLIKRFETGLIIPATGPRDLERSVVGRGVARWQE